MREVPRKRREITPTTARLLMPLFRFSYSRDAYILRGIGHVKGPVLVVKERGAEASVDEDPACQMVLMGRT